MTMSKSNIPDYKYEDLKDLKPNTVVNVYGVVKFSKPPTPTRGSDFSMILSIVDPTLHEDDQKIKCLLFHRDKTKLPFLEVGKIVRLHRLKMTVFHDLLQGQNGPGFSWLAFDEQRDVPIRPIASSSSFTFTQKDKNKVEELREWIATQEDLIPSCKTCFAQMIPQNYYDIYCQVISTCSIEKDTCFLLQVWDGTKPQNPLREFDLTSDEFVVNCQQDLLQRAGNLVLDVALYDDHYTTGLHIKPGQYIKLMNLHAATFTSADSRPDLAGLPTIELVIHKGTAYGRGVHVVRDDFDGLNTLKERLAKIQIKDKSCDELPSSTSDESQGEKRKFDQVDVDDFNPSLASTQINEADTSFSPSSRNENVNFSQDSLDISCYNTGHSNIKSFSDPQPNKTQDSSESKIVDSSSDSINQSETLLHLLHMSPDNKKSRSHQQKTSIDNSLSQGQQQTLPDDSPSKSRCLLQTSTVVLNHPYVQCTKIRDVLEHEAPFKARVLCHVEDHFPRLTRPQDICQLYCLNCHFLCSVPDNNKSKGRHSLTVSRRTEHLEHFLCPYCQFSRDQAELEYAYMMRFLLKDNSGEMVVNLWNRDAVTFFKDITPVEMLTDLEYFTEIQGIVKNIIQPMYSQRPWFECCVQAYKTKDGTKYQIFDTCLV